MAEELQETKETFKQVSSILNLSHPSNWLLEIPIKQVGLGETLTEMGYDKSIFAMNLESFTLGRMTLKSNEVQRSNYIMNFPALTDETVKEFTCTYKLSSMFQQYYFLVKWWEKNLNNISHLEDTVDEDVADEDYFFSSMNLWILDEFKEPCMLIKYKDCWLKELGELQLAYNDSTPYLQHSFTVVYNDFKIKML